MRKLLRKIKEWWIWLFSRRVGEAINDESKSYEDVCRIVQEEMNK
jgi:hypothetical protein